MVLKVVASYNQLTYAGTWNASTNTPTLVSSVGVTNTYYIVSVAGNTNLNGITNWNVGDWAIFNGSVWDRIAGGSTETFSNITVTSLTGYMYANNNSPVTASTTIPNTAITGLGTMSTQNANAVAITGGTINSVTETNGVYANANITSLANTFPNSYLANSSITLGNVTVALGSSASTIGNLTLSNVAISSGNATFTNENVTTSNITNLISGNVAISGGNVNTVTLNSATFGTNGFKLTGQSSPPATSTGTVWYDTNTDTMSYYNSAGEEVTLGQEVIQYVYNNTGSTIAAYSAVYITGDNGVAPTIALAQSNVQSTSQAIGVTNVSIANGAYGYITIIGQVVGVNTSSYTAGQILYLSSTTAGAFQTTAPGNPYFAVRMAFVTTAATNGSIFVSVRNQYVLSGSIVTPLNLTATSTTGQVANFYGFSSSQIASIFNVYTYSGGVNAFSVAGNGTVVINTENVTNSTITNLSSGNVTITGGTTNNLTETNLTVSSGNITVTNANIAYANISTAIRTQGLTGYLYGNDSTGNVTASTTIPNAGLANSTIGLGNATLTLGSTTSTVGNLTLQNLNITSVANTFPNNYLTNSSLTVGNTTISLGGTATSVGNLTLTNVTISSVSTAITAAEGGTGQTSLTANNVILGNGTNAVQFVAPGTSGNVLTSNGTSWISAAATGGVTSFQTSLSGLTPSTATTGAITLAGTLNPANGGTGVTSITANAVVVGNGTGAITTVSPGAANNALISNGTNWVSQALPASGVTVTDDNSTNASRNIITTASNSGTITTVNTSSTELTFNPGTGFFNAPVVDATNGIFINKQTVSSNVTVATGSSAMSVGPVTVANSIVVTVSSGSRWVVL